MTKYETNIICIFDFISNILNDYFILSTKVNNCNLQKVLKELDKLNEAFCRAIDDLEKEFDANIDLESIKYLSEEIERIAVYWKKAQQNFDATEKKGWKLDSFGMKHDIMYTYMRIVANKIELYNKKHVRDKLQTF